MWWTCPSPTKQHGNTNPYPKWVSRICGHGNVELFNEKKFDLTSQMEGAQNFTPPINNI
jgi:hypothetical protein